MSLEPYNKFRTSANYGKYQMFRFNRERLNQQEAEKLKKVTVQDVERLARKVFRNDNHLIVIAE